MSKYTNIQIETALAALERLREENKKPFVRIQIYDVLGSPYSEEVYIKFSRSEIKNGDVEDSLYYWGIDHQGNIDDKVYERKFSTLADKVHFYNTLFPIQV